MEKYGIYYYANGDRYEGCQNKMSGMATAPTFFMMEESHKIYEYCNLDMLASIGTI
jgi:hypothetical protein